MRRREYEKNLAEACRTRYEGQAERFRSFQLYPEPPEENQAKAEGSGTRQECACEDADHFMHRCLRFQLAPDNSAPASGDASWGTEDLFSFNARWSRTDYRK